MKPIALVALFAALTASMGVLALTIKSIVKTDKPSKRDKLILVILPLFILVLIANIILAFLYF